MITSVWVVVCDGCGCLHSTDPDDLIHDKRSSWAIAVSQGWTRCRDAANEGWEHFCPTCTAAL